MKIISEQNSVTSTAAFETLKYTFSEKNAGKIRQILYSGLYTDKILAVIREYSQNAHDANVEAGKKDVPIQVQLPTSLEPILTIRDFGKGLTKKEVENIYIVFGESTKEHSNDFVGQLGIGSKAGHCYGDNFIVTSRCGGTKTVYNCVITGEVFVVSSTKMTKDEMDGMEVSITVKSSDISAFRKTAINLFKYWDVVPNILNINEEEKNTIKTFKTRNSFFKSNNWELWTNSQNAYSYSSYNSSNIKVALMGNIPYTLDYDVLRTKLSGKNDKKHLVNLINFFSSNNLIVKFDIGEIEFSANREALQYTDITFNAIIKKFDSIYSEILKMVVDNINKSETIWDAMITYSNLFSDPYTINKDAYCSNIGALESSLTSNMTWRGVTLKKRFEDLVKWDYELGFSSTSHDYYTKNLEPHYILSTFTRGHNGNVKHKTPKHYNFGDITPSKSSLVLINDTNRSYLAKAAARWILSDEKKGITKVYLLTFKDNAQKASFYKHYNFHTVPTTSLSSIFDKVKKWIKDNKSVNTTGGNLKQIKYLDLKESDTVYWNSVSDKNAKDCKGFFFELSEGWVFNKEKRVASKNEYYNRDLKTLKDCLSLVVKTLNLKVDKIYGINRKTARAKWFETPLKNKVWINIFDYIRENLSKLDMATLSNSEQYKKLGYMASPASTKNLLALKKLVKNENGTFGKFAGVIDEKFVDYYKIIDSFSFLNIELNVDGKNVKKIDFSKLRDDIYFKYPLMREFAFDYLTSVKIQNLADYINLVDAAEKNKK
jgi:hypothetical protein